MAVLVSSCSSPLPGYPPPASSVAVDPNTVPANLTRGGELGTLSASGVVDALGRAGLPVPRALDTTARECVTVGCSQAVVTDTVRIMSFPDTARAQSYAAAHDLFQTKTIVVDFAPLVPALQRDRYRREIHVLVR